MDGRNKVAVIVLLAGLSSVGRLAAQVPGQPPIAPQPVANGQPAQNVSPVMQSGPQVPQTSAQSALQLESALPTAAPFSLSPQEQTSVDMVLRQWQQTGSQVKTFSCNFKLLTFDKVWGDPKNPTPKIEQGELKFVQPDKGLYRVSTEGGEHWVCDGLAIYQFNAKRHELIEHRLPKELQGKAISDGPLPFVFGVDAEKLKQRYWIRIVGNVPAKEGQPALVGLEAYPQWRQDAANFMKVEIFLTDKELLPWALQLTEPQGQVVRRYLFSDIKVNSRLHMLQDFVNVFVNPQTPFGWKRIIEEPPQPQQGQPAANLTGNPAAGGLDQAQRLPLQPPR
jgi:TIGR03009 family protein